METIAAVFDLHAGCRDQADACLLSDAELVALLEGARAGAKTLYLGGDVLELLRGPFPWGDRDAYATIRMCRPMFVRWLEDAVAAGRVVLVNGNHDSALRTLGLIPGTRKKAVHEFRNGLRVLIEHGHHADLVAHRLTWLARPAVWIWGLLTRLGLMDEDSVWRRRAEEFPPGAALTPEQMHDYALARTQEMGCRVGLFGHTHAVEQPTVLGTGADRILYANGGTWTGTRTTLPVVFADDAGKVWIEHLAAPVEAFR